MIFNGKVRYSFTARCFFVSFLLFFSSSNFFVLESHTIFQDHSDFFDEHRTVSTCLKFAPVLSPGGGVDFRYS